MVDDVVCFWISIVEEEDAVMGDFKGAIQMMASLFYSYYSIIASMQIEWIQWTFGFLTGLLG